MLFPPSPPTPAGCALRHTRRPRRGAAGGGARRPRPPPAAGGSLMRAYPTGTVAFLFTDVEGSTGLWARFPDRMPAAYARHDAILRGAAERHGGVVYKVVGDAF